MPLTYNPNAVRVVAASSRNRFVEECACYNIDPDAPGIRVVYPETLGALELREDGSVELREDGGTELRESSSAEGFGDTLILPPGTPWCIIGGTTDAVRYRLTTLFGPSRRISDVFNAIEVDVAINPKLLQMTGN